MAASNILPNNDWQHVAGVFSGSLNRLRLYVNGIEIASGTPSATIVQNLHEVTIGSRQDAAAEYNLNFVGTIDDVRIYNRPLTPREIRALSAAGALPELSIARSGNSITLSWEPNPSLTLVSSGELPATDWIEVPGVVDGSVTITPDQDQRFYQLIRE